MVRSRWAVTLAVLATVVWAGSALALYQEFFPPSADANINTYGTTNDSVEGYAINGDGACRTSTRDHHFLFLGFDIEGDGPNGVPTRDEAPEEVDGQLLLDWLVGKKPVAVALYLNNMSTGSCSTLDAPGTMIPEPQVLVAFRCGNTGRFVDRSVDGLGWYGCCGTWDCAKLGGGENAAPAWRMGRPVDVSPCGPSGGHDRYMYEQLGDIGTADPSVGLVPEFWKASALDSANPNQEIHAGNAALVPPFDADGDGYEGWSGNRDDTESNAEDGMWAFEYLMRYSDAHLVNTDDLDHTNCTDDLMGVPDARMLDGMVPYVDDFLGGWYAVVVDRPLLKAVALGGETKGLVFNSIDATANPASTPRVTTRDQSPQKDSPGEPYLYVIATLAGDVDNDGDVDVFDAIAIVNSFGSTPGDPNWNEEADFDLNGAVNVFDVISLVNNFGQSAP